ncbi:MAG: hypothetical protein K5668_05250 [Lachnospiraceae bacterium]|nr:hypothetical protein [Lachnospiraceae bacterium]
MEENRNPVFSIISLTALAVIIGSWIYLRYSFFTVTAEIKELLTLCRQFLDGTADAAVFLSPAPAGTIEAYSAIFDVTGIKQSYAMLSVILLEALAGVLLYILSKSLLGVFYAFFSVVIMSLLPFFGSPVKVYEELSVLCLLLFEITIAMTWKYEKLFHDKGPFVIRYLFSGITAGLAVFLMPVNIFLVAASLLSSLYFLRGKRKLKLILEYLITLLSAGVVFVILIMIRVMNTGLLPLNILYGYRADILKAEGVQYIFTALLIFLLFVLEIIIDLMPGSKAAMQRDAERKAMEEKDPGDMEEGMADEVPAAAVIQNGGRALVQRPVSTGALPKDFVLHRAGKNEDIISSAAKKEKTVKHMFMPEGPETEAEKAKRISEYRKYAENISPKDLEFDFDVPFDDDFDIEVNF